MKMKRMTVCLSVCLSVCLFVCLSVCLFACLFICLSVCILLKLFTCKYPFQSIVLTLFSLMNEVVHTSPTIGSNVEEVVENCCCIRNVCHHN